MFIGHYGPALALKAAVPKAPIWGLLAACQVMDYAWAGLILTGVEQASIDNGHLEGSALVLSHMPYSHSLLGAGLTSATFAAIVTLLLRRGFWVFVALSLAGISHWFMDLLVHAPDLTLTGSEPYLGFGLWAYKWPSLALEAVLAGGGLWLAARATKPNGGWGAASPWVILALFVALGAFNALGPPPSSIPVAAQMAVAAYTVLVLAGLLMDRTRAVRP
jgi:hypothetical protein